LTPKRSFTALCANIFPARSSRRLTKRSAPKLVCPRISTGPWPTNCHRAP